MKNQDLNFINVQFKPHFLNEFIIGGIPVPTYTATDEVLILKFEKQESYLKYMFILNAILGDLIFADQTDQNYEIQRSKIFVKYVLATLNNSFTLRDQTELDIE